MSKRRKACDTYLTHVCRLYYKGESLVKRLIIRSFLPTLWHSSDVDESMSVDHNGAEKALWKWRNKSSFQPTLWLSSAVDMSQVDVTLFPYSYRPIQLFELFTQFKRVNSALPVDKDWGCKTRNFIIGEWEWLSRRLLVFVCRKPEFKSWYRQKFPLSFKCYYIGFALNVDQKYIPLWDGVLVSYHQILEEEDPYLHESIIVQYFTTQMNWSPWMTPSLKQQIWNISLCYFHYQRLKNSRHIFNLLSAHDKISYDVDAVKEWPGRLIMSCCSSGLTQHL